MTHRSDTHRETSRRERRSRGREQTHQHRGQHQPSMSQGQQQQLHQYTTSHASNSVSTATGGYAGSATPQGQRETDHGAQGYPQAPSTPRAHQGSAQDSQYSPNRDNDRVGIHGRRDDPEDPARRTRSFVQEGHSRVPSSRSWQSGRDIQREREDRARDAINNFNTRYSDANPQPIQHNYGSAQNDPYPDSPDCGDGPDHGGSSYGGH